MFSFNKKIDPNLKSYMAFNKWRTYRVLIKVRNFKDATAKKISSYKGTVVRIIPSCNIICAYLNAKGIERLVEYPEVKYICLDTFMYLCGMSVQSANKVRLSTRSDASGKGIGVGVIDSGVYPHSDLTLPYNRIQYFFDCINGLNYPYDDNGHGTCTCGIICGNGGASKNSYRGVAPESTLFCIKAFDSRGKGYVSDVLFSIDELINMSPKYNIRVLCLPFEMLDYNEFVFNNFEMLIKKAFSNNIITIVPSGSKPTIEGSMTGISLSKYCITVSGLDTTSGVKPYTNSSSGSQKKDLKPDFSAAAVNVVSLNSNTSYLSEKDNIKVPAPKLVASYNSFTGTSISAAYIAGLCVLLEQYYPNLSFDDVYSILRLATEDLELPRNQQGQGKIDINKLFKK